MNYLPSSQLFCPNLLRPFNQVVERGQSQLRTMVTSVCSHGLTNQHTNTQIHKDTPPTCSPLGFIDKGLVTLALPVLVISWSSSNSSRYADFHVRVLTWIIFPRANNFFELLGCLLVNCRSKSDVTPGICDPFSRVVSRETITACAHTAWETPRQIHKQNPPIFSPLCFIDYGLVMLSRPLPAISWHSV